MTHYLFFDNASTTKCEDEVVRVLGKFSSEEFGNPASAHRYGQQSARVIRDARLFFANYFRVEPEQVIFTGSGTEANNLAIYGSLLSQSLSQLPIEKRTLLFSATEHSSVKKTALSLIDFGIQAQSIAVERSGQISAPHFQRLLAPENCFVSIHRVNNVVGTQIHVEALAQATKNVAPHAIFHTDAIQAFGKIEIPRYPSDVDLVSISAHKLGGPKGVGALILLNPRLVGHLRPLIQGGGQEFGLRSGTQNAGLIAGFHIAAKINLKHQSKVLTHFTNLQNHFLQALVTSALLGTDPLRSPIQLNSDPSAVPYIINLSVQNLGVPSSSLAHLLEERGCLVSVGSACHSKTQNPDPVLEAMGLQKSMQLSSIRISFSKHTTVEDVNRLVEALQASIYSVKILTKQYRK